MAEGKINGLDRLEEAKALLKHQGTINPESPLCIMKLAQALAAAELAGKEAGQAWVDLLQAARNMLSANSNIYPGRSREEVEREAYQRLEAAVNALPHPCAAAEPPSKAKGG